ncbi:hypothetical protein LSAT2_027422 [Lamellibrachia satsuma]|nr:hypothetical protein LSAT2_027422 [Lamellibrachia satsuma]
MTRLILLFSLLPAFVYAADEQNTLPRDPPCVVNVNVPDRCCGGADDNYVKKGVRSAANIKQCSKRNLNDDREYGVAMGCDFVKKRNGWCGTAPFDSYTKALKAPPVDVGISR